MSWSFGCHSSVIWLRSLWWVLHHSFVILYGVCDGFLITVSQFCMEFVMVTVMGFVLVLFWKLLHSFAGDFVLGYSGSKQFVMVILIFSMLFWWWLFCSVFFSCCLKIVTELLMVIVLKSETDFVMVILKMCIASKLSRSSWWWIFVLLVLFWLCASDSCVKNG